MNKKALIFLCTALCMGAVFYGCSGNTETKQESISENSEETPAAKFEMKSISELRSDAENLKVNYENLDVTDAKVIIPEVEEIANVLFPISTDSLSKQTQKFEDNIKKFAGLDADTDLKPYMNMMYWDDEKNDRLVIPYKEASDDQMSQIQYLSYNDGKNSSLLIFSNYMLEMGNYELPIALTEDEKDWSKDAYGYRGVDLGTLEKKYMLPEDDISGVTYHLADGDMALEDAVSYMEKHIKEDYYFVGSELLDYQVTEAEVRKLTDTVYYYQFRINASYAGVPLIADGETISGAAEESSELYPFETTHRASMFNCEQMGFVWSCCHSYESVQEQENNKEFISLENACQLLSDYVSKQQNFVISSVSLGYQTEFQYESEEKREDGYIESVYAHPVYHFVVSNPGISGYARLYFNVDALTGNIITLMGDV